MTATPTQLPKDFYQRLEALYGESVATQITAALATGRPTTFRANTVKVSSAEVEAQLTAAGFIVEKIEWLDGFVLRNRGLRELEQHPLYQSGSIYVQGLSSMIPPVVLQPQPGESILDVAAAPGSKTTQMAALMNNQGMILANDTSTVRLYKLQANLEKLGITMVQTQRGLGELIWQTFPEVFDKTLVDVPCSMEGRFNLMKPKTLENWSVRKIKELARRQRSLLRSAISATKVGGEIVYSTCTLSPEENEGVIDWILHKEKHRVEVVPIDIPAVLTSAAVTAWEGDTYNPAVQLTKRILPSELYEGFFIAKLIKKSTSFK